MGLLFFRDQEEYDNFMSECDEYRYSDSEFCDECEDAQGEDEE